MYRISATQYQLIESAKILKIQKESTWSARQGLLYRWTEHSILPISTGGGLFNPNNATQTHSIFVKI